MGAVSEHGRDHLPIEFDIIYRDQPQVRQIAESVSASRARLKLHGRDDRQIIQGQTEGRTGAWRARYRHIATHGARQLTRDTQPQTCSTNYPIGITACKWLEYKINEFFANTRS